MDSSSLITPTKLNMKEMNPISNTSKNELNLVEMNAEADSTPTELNLVKNEYISLKYEKRIVIINVSNDDTIFFNNSKWIIDNLQFGYCKVYNEFNLDKIVDDLVGDNHYYKELVFYFFGKTKISKTFYFFGEETLNLIIDERSSTLYSLDHIYHKIMERIQQNEKKSQSKFKGSYFVNFIIDKNNIISLLEKQDAINLLKKIYFKDFDDLYTNNKKDYGILCCQLPLDCFENEDFPTLFTKTIVGKKHLNKTNDNENSCRTVLERSQIALTFLIHNYIITCNQKFSNFMSDLKLSLEIGANTKDSEIEELLINNFKTYFGVVNPSQRTLVLKTS